MYPALLRHMSILFLNILAHTISYVCLIKTCNPMQELRLHDYVANKSVVNERSTFTSNTDTNNEGTFIGNGMV